MQEEIIVSEIVTRPIRKENTKGFHKMTIVKKLIEQGIVSQNECDELRLDISVSALNEYEKTDPQHTDINNEAALMLGEQDALLLDRIVKKADKEYRLSEATDVLKVCEDIQNQYANRTDNCIAALYPVYRYFNGKDEEKRKIITFVFRKTAAKLPDPVKIAASRQGQNLLYWFGVYLSEFEMCYEAIFKLPALFGIQEENGLTEKEWVNQRKESVLSLFDIFVREAEYASFFRNNYSKTKIDIVPTDSLSEYRYRFTLARMPVWLYYLAEEEKAVRLLSIAYDEMDVEETKKEAYREEIIKIALDCSNFDSFQELYVIITKANKSVERKMDETEHLLNLYLHMKKPFFENCSKVKKAMSEDRYAGYAKEIKKLRNIVSEDDFPVCEIKRCIISDSQSIKRFDDEWVYREDCQTIAQLSEKLKKYSLNERDIEDLRFWLSSMSSDTDVINNRSFDSELQRLRDLSYLKQNGSDKEIKTMESMLELEKHRDELYVIKTNDEIIRLKQTINAQEEDEEEEVIRQTKNPLSDLQDYLMKRSSDRELAQKVKEGIKKDMQTYCKTYLQDVNTHADSYSLFDKVGNQSCRDDIYNQIFSGLLYYEKLKSLNGVNIDYSGCVLQMTRGVEALLRFIYDNLTTMPQSVGLPVSNADKYYYDNNGTKKTEIEMGPLMYLFKCRNHCSKVMQYGRNVISLNNLSAASNPSLAGIDLHTLVQDQNGNMNDTIQHIQGNEENISQTLFDAINYVKESYRNKSAHAGTMFGLVDAGNCREILLNTECLLWILLTMLK